MVNTDIRLIIFFGGKDGEALYRQEKRMGADCDLDHELLIATLDQEDSLKEGMATHSGILAWIISWTEEPGGLQSKGSRRVIHD